MKTSVTVGTIDLLTYPYSDPDPVPATDRKFWPYSRFDGSTASPVMRTWKCVVLESDRLKITILPEIGGKIWGALDKVSGHEFIYFNHVVKFRDIAMCGPWTSGGIEFNFGVIGHNPTTSVPIPWTVRENADGSASYFCGNRELICGTTWQVEVNLKCGDDFFTTRTRWFNSSLLDESYYQWMNAAYSAKWNPEFAFTGTNRIGHEGEVGSWPIDEDGHDLSKYQNNAFGNAKSYHIVGGNERFFSIWWPEINLGSYHENVMGDKYGRKIFFWALSREGGIWEDLLTDSDGQYIELQSGRCFNQGRKKTYLTPFKHPPFTPGRTDCFTEKWGVVRDHRFIEEHEKPEDMTERPVTTPENFDWTSAYGLYYRGELALREHEFVTAREYSAKALEKDPYLPPALVLAAELAFRQERYDLARKYAQRALSINAYDYRANYLDALACEQTGLAATALERFGMAAYAMEYRSASYAGMARIELKRGNTDSALDYADKSRFANPLSIEAMRLQIAVNKALGHTDIADHIAAEFASIWPTVPLSPPSAPDNSSLPQWKRDYLQAQKYAAAGRDEEADALLNKCDAADDPSLFIYRASRKKGETALADLDKATAIGDSWRVGRAKMKLFAEAEDWKRMRETGYEYNRRYPHCNPIEILYAKALLELKEYQACVDFLKDVHILPSEFGDNATGIWQQAWKGLGNDDMANSYPENLGTGAPFPKTAGK